MNKNQYLVTNRKLENFEGGFHNTWSGLNVYVDTSSRLSISKSHAEVLIIGTVVDYRNPSFSRDDIAGFLSKLTSINEIIDNSNHLTGRYALFVSIGDQQYAITDTCALKRIVYGKMGADLVLTSSEIVYYKLFATSPQMNPEVEELQKKKSYLKQENPWFGYSSVDSRLNILIPNRILHINTLKEERIDLPNVKTNDYIQAAANILSKTYDALAHNFKTLVQPVTAGFDSRILLAASLKHKQKIKYYVFGVPQSNEVDVVIPQKLSETLDFKFSVVDSRETISEEFAGVYTQSVLFPRTLNKTRNIFYHYKNSPEDTINLNGNGGEIFRCYYGVLYTKPNKKRLSFLVGANKYPLLTNKVQQWYTDSIEYAKRNNVPITDLMYWEQRMALWGSKYPLEQDIAIEEVSAYNNRFLLSLLLVNSSQSERKGPDYKLARALCNALNKDVLKVPVNPSGLKVRLFNRFIQPYSDMKILAKQIRSAAR